MSQENPMAHVTEAASPPRSVHWLFLVFTFALALNVGAALLASTVIFPMWSHSPEAARAWTGEVNEALFFMRLSPLVVLLAAGTFLMSYRGSTPDQRWFRASALLYLVFFAVTIAYFVPGQEKLHGAGGASIPLLELSSRLRTWVVLNWGRQAVGLIALGCALYGLSSIRPRDSVLVRAS